MNNNKVVDEAKIIGIHTFKIYNNTLPGFIELEKEMEDLVATKDSRSQVEQRQKYEGILYKMEGFKVREKVVHNLITTVGRSVLAQRLANTTTYTGIINYGALGSSSTAVANGDTQLGTEVFRKTVASTSYTTNVAFIDFYYSKADTNGTYAEFGTFIDGTGSANSGQMFTHALTGGWSKTSSESMVVSCQYTLS